MAMAISVPLYTVDDLANFPDDGNRYELLDGMLLVTPDESVELCTARARSRVVRDTIRWRVAGVQVTIDLDEVFAGIVW